MDDNVRMPMLKSFRSASKRVFVIGAAAAAWSEVLEEGGLLRSKSSMRPDASKECHLARLETTPFRWRLSCRLW